MRIGRYVWHLRLALVLILLSLVLYFVHYLLFRDLHLIEIYFLFNLAFLPIEVILVTLVLHGLMNARERQSRLFKQNMAIGAFFSEVGTPLLRLFQEFATNAGELAGDMRITPEWSNAHFVEMINRYSARKIEVACHDPALLARLKDFLGSRRGFLLGLLENPNLLEHEAFTDLLWAIFHLAEELEHRPALDQLPTSDLAHLEGDIERAFSHLTRGWLVYMQHLRDEYPYLFSLAVRTNPFRPKVDAVVR